jgi:hypothetical protein
VGIGHPAEATARHAERGVVRELRSWSPDCASLSRVTHVVQQPGLHGPRVAGVGPPRFRMEFQLELLGRESEGAWTGDVFGEMSL